MANSRQPNDNGNVSKEVERCWNRRHRRLSSGPVSPGGALYPARPALVNSILDGRYMLVGDSTNDVNWDVVFDRMNPGIVDA